MGAYLGGSAYTKRRGRRLSRRRVVWSLMDWLTTVRHTQTMKTSYA